MVLEGFISKIQLKNLGLLKDTYTSLLFVVTVVAYLIPPESITIAISSFLFHK